MLKKSLILHLVQLTVLVACLEDNRSIPVIQK